MTEFKVGSNKEEYKIEKIWDSTVYIKESAIDHLPDFYYLLS